MHYLRGPLLPLTLQHAGRPRRPEPSQGARADAQQQLAHALLALAPLCPHPPPQGRLPPPQLLGRLLLPAHHAHPHSGRNPWQGLHPGREAQRARHEERGRRRAGQQAPGHCATPVAEGKDGLRGSRSTCLLLPLLLEMMMLLLQHPHLKRLASRWGDHARSLRSNGNMGSAGSDGGTVHVARDGSRWDAFTRVCGGGSWGPGGFNNKPLRVASCCCSALPAAARERRRRLARRRWISMARASCRDVSHPIRIAWPLLAWPRVCGLRPLLLTKTAQFTPTLNTFDR